MYRGQRTLAFQSLLQSYQAYFELLNTTLGENDEFVGHVDKEVAIAYADATIAFHHNRIWVI